MIRYYEPQFNLNSLKIYEEKNSRQYNVSVLILGGYYKNRGIKARKDVDISKMYASNSEDIYNMLTSKDAQLQELAFELIRIKWQEINNKS